jgi:hypothetical protein
MSDSNIICGNHGASLPVLACQHLVAGPVEMIYFIPQDAENPKQGWCGICEDARMEDRGWYDYADSVAQWCWLCDFCFSDAMGRSQEVIQVANPETTPDLRPEG